MEFTLGIHHFFSACFFTDFSQNQIAFPLKICYTYSDTPGCAPEKGGVGMKRLIKMNKDNISSLPSENETTPVEEKSDELLNAVDEAEREMQRLYKEIGRASCRERV